MNQAVMRADLHLHSDHSGLKQLRFLGMRDCYSPPVEVYRRAKQRGMDLVTLTDHDTIDGCLEIRDRLGDPADFFMSEEVETFLPGNRSMHIGVFGISEAQHAEIQRLRQDWGSLVGYLEEQRIPSSLNHLFRGYRPGMDVGEYLEPLVGRFDLFETRNGTQSARYRELIERTVARYRRGRPPAGETAGSDAHTLLRVARTWTQSPGTDVASFLDSLRAGKGLAAGADGRLLPLARDVYSVILTYYGSLAGRGRLPHEGRRWPAGLFVLATAPSHLIGLPFLATSGNLLLKRLGLSRIEAALGRLERADDTKADAEPDLLTEP